MNIYMQDVFEKLTYFWHNSVDGYKTTLHEHNLDHLQERQFRLSKESKPKPSKEKTTFERLQKRQLRLSRKTTRTFYKERSDHQET